MRKFTSLKNFNQSNLPDDVAKSVQETLQILDTYYGTDRTDSNLGGYVLVVENSGDLKQLADIFNESIENVIPETTEMISKEYLKVTYILNPDFAVVIIFSAELIPSKVKEYIHVSQNGQK